MPFPLLHLIIAENAAESLKIGNKYNYYLGTITPDALCIKSNWTRDQKRDLHLTKCSRELSSRTNEVARFFNYHKNIDADFLKGYCVHIHTDNLWSHLLHRYYRETLSSGTDNEEMNKTYYSEMNTIMTGLRKRFQVTETIIKTLKSTSKSFSLLFLSETDIGNWKNHVIDEIENSSEYTALKYYNHEIIELFTKTVQGFIETVTVLPQQEQVFENYKEHALARNYWT